MFNLTLRLDDFERKARDLQAARDQVPFALSLAMNQAALKTREHLIEDTWPQHVTQRNATFIHRALRTEFSTKRDLAIAIYDDLGRAGLKLHADGGAKQPRHRALAIPPAGSRPRESRGARGVRKSLRPGAIIASTPKRALRITSKGLFVGQGGRLHLMYAFKPSAAQPADVPFRQDFARWFTAQVELLFPAAMAKAMSTRR